jgi:hypothetical protein
MELLFEIVEYLRSGDKSSGETLSHPLSDLASFARVSRQFYEVAMPLLWEKVSISDHFMQPPCLSSYFGTSSERVLRYIRTLTLTVASIQADLERSSCNRLRKYFSGCLRLLIAAKSLQKVTLRAEAINPDDHAPELGKKIKLINVIFFRILKYTARMNFRTLNFYALSDFRLNEVMRIIGPKLTTFQFLTLHEETRLEDCCDWLQTCQNMTWFKLMYYFKTGDEKNAEPELWVALSKLTNLATVIVTNLPIPLVPVNFPNIVNFDLRLWREIEVRDWWCAILVILNLMPNLEISDLHLMTGSDFERWTAAMSIDDCKCYKLREIRMSLFVPEGLLPTIAKYCPNLTLCELHVHNVDNEDLRSLSRCRQLRSLSLRGISLITTGVAYLTNLDQLGKLELHFSVGKYIDSQLLLDLASHCPKLFTIDVSDWLRCRGPGPYQEMSFSEIFPLCGELEECFEACFKEDIEPTPSILEKYRIRLDLLRSRASHRDGLD